MNNKVTLLSPSAGTTEQVDSTNNAQELPDSVKYQDGDSSNDKQSNKAEAVLITVEEGSVRFAFQSDPTQDGDTALGHILGVGESIKLMSWSHVAYFQFISKVADDHATLQITPEY